MVSGATPRQSRRSWNRAQARTVVSSQVLAAIAWHLVVNSSENTTHGQPRIAGHLVISSALPRPSRLALPYGEHSVLAPIDVDPILG